MVFTTHRRKIGFFTAVTEQKLISIHNTKTKNWIFLSLLSPLFERYLQQTHHL